MIDFNANDPDNPIIIPNVDGTLPDPCPPFNVVGRSDKPNMPSEQQSEFVYHALANNLRFVQERLNTKITKWSSTKQLIVLPRAFKQLNAFYDRRTLSFGFFPVKNNKILFSCLSADCVVHEAGHSLLDSIRFDLWNVIAIEVASFHEAFGDMNSILCTLSFPEVIDFILKETNNNIRLPNAVTKLAESMGILVGHDYLRNAVNDFKYVLPESLPKSASEGKLSSECHSFSRLYTAAFYDIICNQYEKNLAESNPKESLIKTRDQVARVLYNSLQHIANTPRFYDAAAKAMLLVDASMGNECHDSILKAFTDRNILLEPPITNFAIKMDGEEIKTFNHSEGASLRIGGIKKVKLIDNLIISQAENPLYFVDIDIPCEHYIEMDSRGMVAFQQPTILEESLESAKVCLDYLYENNKVAMHDDPEKQFNVIDGHLKRNHICQKYCMVKNESSD